MMISQERESSILDCCEDKSEFPEPSEHQGAQMREQHE